MALPKIDSPIFNVTVPYVNIDLKMRPYKMKEEKILLIAQQSEDPQQMVIAMMQVINNCIVEGELDIESLPSFVVEYLLLQLRKQSVGNSIKLKFEDLEDNQEYEFDINLEDINIRFNEDHTDSIELTEDIGLLMKYPSISDAAGMIRDGQNEVEQTFSTIKFCIDKVFTEDEVIEFQDHSDDEKDEFIDQFTQEQLEKLMQFFETMPSLSHTITYKNSLDNERKIELNGVADFFS